MCAGIRSEDRVRDVASSGLAVRQALPCTKRRAAGALPHKSLPRQPYHSCCAWRAQPAKSDSRLQSHRSNHREHRSIAMTRERVVWKLYLGLLGRAPDPGGFEHYLERLNAGHSLEDIFEGFLSSPEFREREWRRFDEFWFPEGLPIGRLNRAIGETLLFSRELIVSNTINETGRIAVVAPYPPARTGVARATLNTFGHWERGVDFFGEFESLAQLKDATAELKASAHDHRVFSYGFLTEAVDSVPYRAIVFAFGNSHHNVPVLYSLLKIPQIGNPPPIVAYIHDPVVLNVLRRAAGPAGYDARGLIERAYGPECRATFEHGDYDALVQHGVCGVRALRLATRIDHVVVNSAAAREIVLRDDPGLNAAAVHRLFHPIFTTPPRSPRARSYPTASLRVGCFGVGSRNKRLDVVLQAGACLAAHGISAHLVIAGYEFDGAIQGEDFPGWGKIELHRDPDDHELAKLMDGVDVAVQLRDKNTGETSGVVSMLVGLATPVIVTRIGAFCEFGEAVRFVRRDASSEEVATALISILDDTENVRSAASVYSAARTPQKFCEELDAILSRGHRPVSARTPQSLGPTEVNAALQRRRTPDSKAATRIPINVFGYYGCNNAGDDAFGLFFQELFGASVRLRVNGSYRDETHARVILGGGTVLTPYFRDRLPEFERLDVIGVSMDDRDEGARLLADLRERLGIVALRSAADAAAARTHGVASEIFPDLAFALQPPEPSLSVADIRAMAQLPAKGAIADRTAVFFLSDHYSARSDWRPGRANTITTFKCNVAAALDQLLLQYNIVLVPMSVWYGWRDASFAHDIVARTQQPERVTLIENYLGPIKILDLIGSVADVVISMKYHGLIFGMLCGKPVINIADSNKNADLMSETGLHEFDLRIVGTSTKALLEAVARAPLATPIILEIKRRYRGALEPLKARLLHAYS